MENDFKPHENEMKMPGLYFLTSAIHVVVPPALGVAVEIAHHEHVGVFHTDKIERQRLVVWAVEVHEFNPFPALAPIRFDVCLPFLGVNLTYLYLC